MNWAFKFPGLVLSSCLINSIFKDKKKVCGKVFYNNFKILTEIMITFYSEIKKKHLKHTHTDEGSKMLLINGLIVK